MKKILFTVLFVSIIVGVVYAIKSGSDTKNSDEAIALVSSSDFHAKVVGQGWIPMTFVEIDLGGPAGEEVFGSYGSPAGHKTAFVVFSNDGEWKPIAYNDFLASPGEVSVFTKKIEGSEGLFVSLPLQNVDTVVPINLIKINSKNGYGFNYEIDMGF